MLLQTSSLSNQDISTALLVGTYTPTAEVPDLTIQVVLDQIAGGGDYVAYATRQLNGAGTAYKSAVTTETVGAGVTSFWFATIEMGVNAGDVIKIYVLGRPADTTTPDITCEFWGLAGAAVATGTTAALYASLAEFKAWVTTRGGTVGADAADDTTLTALLEAASRYVDRETGRRFYQDASDNDYYYSGEDDEFRVKLPDFASITAVYSDYTGVWSYSLLAATDYTTTPDNAALEGLPFTGLEIAPTSLTSAYFPHERKGVKVTGKRGWPAVPSHIKTAVMAIAQSVNSSRSGQASAGKVSVSAGAIVIRPEDVPTFAQKIIEHYRSRI